MYQLNASSQRKAFVLIVKTVDNFNSMELYTTRYLKESGELVVEYDGELVGDNYEVVYYDHSNEINVYSNNIFEVEVD